MTLPKIEDAIMLEVSKTIRAFFIQDKADFVAFDSDTFADPAAPALPFATVWLNAINAAETFIGDDAVIDQQVQKREAVEAALKLCRNHFQDAKYFIEKTFPDNIPVWNEFGYNDYEKSRQSQPLMVQFMKVFFKIATKYKLKLIAKGYPQTEITKINTLKTQLNNADISQETFKGDRGVLTQDRIKLLNAVWKITKLTGKAGKQIFQNNFAKYVHYLLPPDEQPTFPKEGLNDAGETVSTYHPQKPLPPTKLYLLKSTGTTQQVFCLSATKNGVCSGGVIIQPGTEEIHPASDLGDLANLYLNVTNLGGVQGSWLVDEA